jgi:thioredoxin-related protein
MLMRRFLLPAAASVVVGLFAIAGLARSEDSLWQTDFEKAKAQAKAEKKLLLVDFTGSDWCAWCKKLQGEVFSKEAFQKEAPKQFVLVELDFPQDKKKLSEAAIKRNDELAKHYKVQGFPTILVLDAEGHVMAKTGYRPDGPEKYVTHLADLVNNYGIVQALKKGLAKSEGVARAKLLDQIIDVSEKLGNDDEDLEAWAKQIVKLDSDNKAGLKTKYEFRILVAEVENLKEEGKAGEALAALDKALALPGISGDQKQKAFMAKGELCYISKDIPGIESNIKKAIEAAPKTEEAKQCEMLLEKLRPIFDAQANIAKVKTKLEKAAGVDRAKLLDELITLEEKAGQFAKVDPQEVEKWSREIISLDPDNKAGLKSKYAFNVALNEATHLLFEGDAAEGQALLEKALAAPGLSGEQIQEGNFRLGYYFLKKKSYQKGIDFMTKAYEAAPTTQGAKSCKMMIQQAKQLLKLQDENEKTKK